MRAPVRRPVLILLGLFLTGCAGHAPQSRQSEPFGDLVESLSEPGGYFDTDNLISNERSYLHVLPELADRGVRGGAYIGVGPDQNFSYIAAVRPELAYLIDVRRDNMLQHLMFKALFRMGGTRIEYLCLLFGRRPPDALNGWTSAPIERLVAYVDAAPLDPVLLEEIRDRVDELVRSFGVPLGEDDLVTVDRFHRAFATAGLSLRFRSFGRGPRFHYPTYRDLLLESDPSGRKSNYLADEEDFRFLRDLQAGGRLIPVVGDLAGGHALAAIGRDAAGRGLSISAFYTSNVEFYLFRSGIFPRFMENVASLPTDDRSVVIRSVFNRVFGPHPLAVPGYLSTQLTQGLVGLRDGWEAGAFRTYWGLVTSDLPAGRERRAVR